MVDDVATPSNLPVSLVKKEELEEASLDVNVSQWSREEESSRRVVRTWVDRSAWDRRLSPNLHALAIYLKFVPTCGATPERFEECQCEDDDVRLHYRTWVPVDGHYRWRGGPINPLSMEHWTEYHGDVPSIPWWCFISSLISRVIKSWKSRNVSWTAIEVWKWL